MNAWCHSVNAYRTDKSEDLEMYSLLRLYSGAFDIVHYLSASDWRS